MVYMVNMLLTVYITLHCPFAHSYTMQENKTVTETVSFSLLRLLDCFLRSVFGYKLKLFDGETEAGDSQRLQLGMPGVG